MKILFSKPWLKSSSFDLILIILPSLISVGMAWLLVDSLGGASAVPYVLGLILFIGVDSSHVYSTLFRTYFNSHELKENKMLLLLMPIFTWALGVIVYSISHTIFWLGLAYMVVFHFLRQQYGFMRIYSRNDSQNKLDYWLSGLAVYGATLYPLVYWHCHDGRKQRWFGQIDFFMGLPPLVSQIFGVIYVGILICHFGNEILNLRVNKPINLPKNLIIIFTAISWYASIVYFNGAVEFTIINVVSHGVPYLGLIWLYGERQKNKPNAPLVLGRFSYRLFFSITSIPLFLLVLLFFGYIEVNLWEGFVWRKSIKAFGFIGGLPDVTAKATLAWLVPLIAVPQITHYILDGFIWKVKDKEANWQKVLFSRR